MVVISAAKLFLLFLISNVSVQQFFMRRAPLQRRLPLPRRMPVLKQILPYCRGRGRIVGSYCTDQRQCLAYEQCLYNVCVNLRSVYQPIGKIHDQSAKE